MDVEETTTRRVRIPLTGGQELRVSRTGEQVAIRRGYSDRVDELVEALERITEEGADQ